MEEPGEKFELTGKNHSLSELEVELSKIGGLARNILPDPVDDVDPAANNAKRLTEKQHMLGGISPLGFLILFTTINMLIYADRSIFSASIDSMTRYLGYSATQIGLLGSLFTVGFTVASPVCANAVAKYPPLLVAAIGLIVWAAAVIMSGLGQNFETIAAGRLLSGVGEASFLCSAPTLINSTAPPANRSLWLSAFFSCITVGAALGAIVGGQIINSQIFGINTWRYTFVGEAIIMAPLIIFCMFIKGPKSIGELSPTDNSAEDGSLRDVYQKVKELMTNFDYLFVVLGITPTLFVINSMALYMISYMTNVLQLNLGASSSAWGLITLIAGFAGSGTGGSILDALRKKYDYISDPRRSMLVGVKISIIFSIVAVVVLSLAFSLPGTVVFFVFLAMGKFFLVGSWIPSNPCILWSVPVTHQPLAVALSSMFTQVFGGALASIEIGAALDYTNKNYQLVMMQMVLVLVPGLLFWAILLARAARNAKREADKKRQSVSQVGTAKELFIRTSQIQVEKATENAALEANEIIKEEEAKKLEEERELRDSIRRVTETRLSLMSHRIQ